jgi:deoxyribodipyrimidine photo-lyase
MTLTYEHGLFIFRRDFRVIDNVGLNIANNICKRIYPIFIFTPEQVTGANKFKSVNAVQFMIESLQDLSSQILKMGGHLMCFYGNNNTIVSYLIKELDINVVCFNADYSPYAIQRELGIIQICDKLNIAVEYGHDYYLHPPGSIVNGQGEPYKKFTPYYNVALKMKVDAPAGLRKIHFASSNKHLPNIISLDNAFKKFVGKENPDILVNGGRGNAIKQLKVAVKTQSHYSKTHNNLDKQTSQLSAYINFGCVSIREVYKVFKGNKEFIRQLNWGSFYINILYNYPDIIYKSLRPKYDNIKWHHNEIWFQKWCKGETNFPVIDACMKQLNTTGFLHGRGRLIVSSFLVKTMLIDYKKGEKYFANKLTDYNVSNNLNNWMWVTGNGASSQEYFRIFNPWSQSLEHDPNAIYIKQWLPQLKDIPAKAIHKWYDEWENYKNTGYGKPILDYDEQKKKCLEMYRNALK